MFVNVKETSPEPSILSKAWNSKNQAQLSITCVDMLVYDSPKLTEPRYVVYRAIALILLTS